MIGLVRPLFLRHAILLVAFAASAAGAQDLSQAQRCSRILDGNARLACFDAVFGRPSDMVGTAGTVARPAPTAVPAKPAAAVAQFGDRGQLPTEKAARADIPKRINCKVVKSADLARGLFQLTMDNGQVWVTKESDWALDFKAGDEVTIQRMALGGFRVSHAGQGRNVTVARIQ